MALKSAAMSPYWSAAMRPYVRLPALFGACCWVGCTAGRYPTAPLARSAGMSNAHASILVALYLGGGGLGGLLGGWIGDTAARHFPNHGRIAATQFSVLVGIPFVAVLFKVRQGRGSGGK